jgi:hypothetical protein
LGLEIQFSSSHDIHMGFLTSKLLQGTKHKCIDSYLSDMFNRYLAAIKAGFPALPITVVNIHIEMAPSYFQELDVFLRIKNNFSPIEIDEHFLHAESMALATLCRNLGFEYEQAEDVLSDKAFDLADSFFDESLTPQENFSRISRGKELAGKSVLFRQWVLRAFEFIYAQED